MLLVWDTLSRYCGSLIETGLLVSRCGLRDLSLMFVISNRGEGITDWSLFSYFAGCKLGTVLGVWYCDGDVTRRIGTRCSIRASTRCSNMSTYWPMLFLQMKEQHRFIFRVLKYSKSGLSDHSRHLFECNLPKVNRNFGHIIWYSGQVDLIQDCIRDEMGGERWAN